MTANNKGKYLNSAWKDTGFQLFIPLFHPSIRTHCFENFLKICAWFMPFTTTLLTTMEFHIGKPAMSRHIRVWKTWIHRNCFQLIFGFFCFLLFFFRHWQFSCCSSINHFTLCNIHIFIYIFWILIFANEKIMKMMHEC